MPLSTPLISGDGTTDCCLVEHTRDSSSGRSSIRVLGSHGNPYLGAVDVKLSVLSRLLDGLQEEVPDSCLEPLMVSRQCETLASPDISARRCAAQAVQLCVLQSCVSFWQQQCCKARYV
jgi:hypothetical protein